jgi:hypothetical protein
MLGAALGLMLPWSLVPCALTFLALTGAGLGFYSLGRASALSRPVAAGASCIYLANPYLLFVAYERTAYGELLGAVTMPLVVLYALRPQPKVVALAAVMALLWLTNAPAAVMGCYLLMGCSVAAAVGSRSVLPVIRAMGGLALGTGLAGVYVVPAAYEQRWVEIARATGEGMRVEDSFLFEHTGEAYHDQVLHTASAIAVAILAVGMAAAVCFFILQGIKARKLRQGKDFRGDGAGEHTTASLYGGTALGSMLVILFLLLPASDRVWRLAPKLYFLQFPWRLLLVGGMAAGLALGLLGQAWGALWKQHRLDGQAKGLESSSAEARSRYGAEARTRDGSMSPAWRVGAVLALCLAAIGAGRYALRQYGQFCDEEDNVTAQQGLLSPLSSASGAPLQGFEGTDEYTPVPADNGEIQRWLPAVRLLPAAEADEGDDAQTANPQWSPGAEVTGEVQVEDWSPEHVRVLIEAGKAGYAVLRLEDYPAWRVLVNGVARKSRVKREDGLLTVSVGLGMNSIDVRYQATPDAWAGRAISLTSLLLLAGVWGLGRVRL